MSGNEVTYFAALELKDGIIFLFEHCGKLQTADFERNQSQVTALSMGKWLKTKIIGCHVNKCYAGNAGRRLKEEKIDENMKEGELKPKTSLMENKYENECTVLGRRGQRTERTERMAEDSRESSERKRENKWFGSSTAVSLSPCCRLNCCWKNKNGRTREQERDRREGGREREKDRGKQQENETAEGKKSFVVWLKFTMSNHLVCWGERSRGRGETVLVRGRQREGRVRKREDREKRRMTEGWGRSREEEDWKESHHVWLRLFVCLGRRVTKCGWNIGLLWLCLAALPWTGCLCLYVERSSRPQTSFSLSFLFLPSFLTSLSSIHHFPSIFVTSSVNLPVSCAVFLIHPTETHILPGPNQHM